MKKKTLAVILSIILFFGIIIGGMYLFEMLRPAPKTSNFYTDGLYIKYKIHWENPVSGSTGHGWITLTVKNGLIYLNATLPHFYSSYLTDKPLYRKIVLTHTGDTVYYHGEKVVLPFFYAGGKVVSQYGGNYTNTTQKVVQLNSLQGGIIEFQKVYFLYTVDRYLFPNGSVWNEGDPGTYEYGYNTNLLFFMDCAVANDPIINIMLNLTHPSSDGNVTYYIPVSFGLSLHETNLDLGPVDYFSLILTFIVLGLPVLILIAIPVAIIYLYRWAKSRKEVKNR